MQIDGILIIDKDKGLTSHDVVAAIRRKFNIKKVGHAGTLDPNATGVLVMLLGKGTKRSEDFLQEEKEYIATMKLGERTDSADCKGKLIQERPVNVTVEEVKTAVTSFYGDIEQIPPMVSAKKIRGKRLYKLARKGIEVERQPRKINISEIEIEKIELPYVVFRVACSKGTYIRQLADDIGEKLGCGAHLTELRRTRSGEFTLERAMLLDTVLELSEDGLNENIIRI